MALIRYQKGDIFDSRAQVIVNTVNCKGAMGRGLALAFKERYPAMFRVYQQECKTGKLHIGRPTLYQGSNPWILNFPTKYHWRFPSKLEYIEKGLEFLVANYQKAGIKSIAFPKLGTQNGKLSWDEVGPLMARYLSRLDIDVYVYIAEDDKEYQAEDNRLHRPNVQFDRNPDEMIWAKFNELALSVARLQQEVGLSKKQAEKVADKRRLTEFKSLADIQHIEGIAPTTSFPSIKKYINNQKYAVDQLLELPDGVTQHPAEAATNAISRKRKKFGTSPAITRATLFNETELVGKG